MNFQRIKEERAKLFVEEFKITCDVNKFTNDMEVQMTNLVFMPGVKKVLSRIHDKNIIIITDASKARRKRTIDNSSFMKKQFKVVNIVSSEDANALKPSKSYFDYINTTYITNHGAAETLVMFRVSMR
jgi:FMN phosphatase YigB (HAD superfamily)